MHCWRLIGTSKSSSPFQICNGPWNTFGTSVISNPQWCVIRYRSWPNPKYFCLADSMLSLQNKTFAINWWFLWSYPVRTHFYWFDKFSGTKMPLVQFKISKHFARWQLNKNELEGFLWSPKSKPMPEWSYLVYWDICKSYNHIHTLRHKNSKWVYQHTERDRERERADFQEDLPLKYLIIPSYATGFCRWRMSGGESLALAASTCFGPTERKRT